MGPGRVIARLADMERLVSMSVTTEFDLDALRNEIDDIDHKILDLVARRIAAVVQIGDYKRARGLAVYDAARERAVLQRLMSQAPAGLDPQVVRRVFERIIDESRGIEQHQVISVRPPEE
jgi:chorismate mutase